MSPTNPLRLELKDYGCMSRENTLLAREATLKKKKIPITDLLGPWHISCKSGKSSEYLVCFWIERGRQNRSNVIKNAPLHFPEQILIAFWSSLPYITTIFHAESDGWTMKDYLWCKIVHWPNKNINFLKLFL